MLIKKKLKVRKINKEIRDAMMDHLPALKREIRATCAEYDLVAQYGIIERDFGPYRSMFSITGKKSSIQLGDSTRKSISNANKHELRLLRQLGRKLSWVWDLSESHWKLLLAYDLAQEFPYHSVQTRISHRSLLFQRVGKYQIVPASNDGLIPEEYERTTQCATQDLSWGPLGLSVEALKLGLMMEDAWAGDVLEALELFGARVEEGLCVDAHHHDLGDVLVLRSGTKNGLLRIVPIETDRQRAFLVRLRSTYDPGPLFASVYCWDLYRAHKRFDGIVGGKLKVTLEEAGTTSRGLRMEYAINQLEAILLVPAPVRGGPAVAPRVSRSGRGAVSLILGHGESRNISQYVGRSTVDARIEVPADHVGLKRAAWIKGLYEKYADLRLAHGGRPREYRRERDPLGLLTGTRNWI